MDKKPSVFSIPLVRELTVILVVKLAVLFTIAQLFFQSPEHEQPAGDRFENYLGLPARNQPDVTTGVVQPSPSYQETSDDQ